MKYKDFKPTLWEKIHTLTALAKTKDPDPIAVFDADGTLWDTDLGENFFQFQITEKKMPLPEEPWNHYLELKKKNNDPREAYLWLAQICAGFSLTEIQSWARTALEREYPVPIFPDQKKLIEFFHSQGVRIYIVTASVSWAVQPGAEKLNVPAKNVIGVETKVVEGSITQEPVMPITYKEGKLAALLKHTYGKYPFFACGNTLGDSALLASATLFSLAVCSTRPDDPLYRAEKELQDLAQKKNWEQHSFI